MEEISNVILKEKEQQNELYKEEYGDEQPMSEEIAVHKQSLINLKEYIEFQMNNLVGLYGNFAVFTCQSEEDIKELTKMIGRYE